MNIIRRFAVLFAALAFTLAACKPATLIVPINIDSVEVEVSGREASAHVTGVVGDSCSTALPPEVKRDGDTVTVTINAEREQDAVCAELALLYDEMISLGNDFAPGDYMVEVNGVEAFFSVK